MNIGMKGGAQVLGDVAWPLGTAFALCVVWQIAVISGNIPQYLLPAPSDVALKIGTSLPDLLTHSAISGVEALAAFVLATVAGFVVAVLLAYSPLLRDAVYPIIVAFQLIPKVALAPLFIVWLGTDSVSRITFATFLSFFPVLISTLTGLQGAEPNAVRLCRSLNGTEWQTFISVRIPFSLPYFFSSIKVAATLAVTGIIVAEFITANAGLGFLILSAAPRMETLTIFAAIVMLCAVGLALYGVVELLERAGRRWFKGA